MWTDPILMAIFRWFPARETIFKPSGPRPREEYEIKVERPFSRWFGLSPEDMLQGMDVLDIGSGFGASAIWFREHGARSVTGIEVEDDKVAHAARFAHEMGVDGVRFDRGIGEALPFDDESFDLVTMDDVLEHVVDPAQCLAEAYRVLRPAGRLAAVFPPYYHPTAGSHLRGYATTLPGLNLLFTTRQLRSATTKLLEAQDVDYRRYLRDVPTDKLWNMNGITIRRFRSMLRGLPFEAEMIRYLGHPEPRVFENGSDTLARAGYRFLGLAARVPVLQEAFCLRVCALLRRPTTIQSRGAGRPCW